MDIFLGSQITPPLAPPNGILTTAHFHVIQLARARTSSSVTSGAYRTPPLAGPRAMECCTRYPVKTSTLPLSIPIGMCTMISRLGERRIFHMPSSRLSFVAAKSKRATCAAEGFSSSLIGMVFMGGAVVVLMLAPETVFECGIIPGRRSEGGTPRQPCQKPPARLRGGCRLQTKSIGSSMGPWQVEPPRHAPAGIPMVNSVFSYLSAEAVRTFACP